MMGMFATVEEWKFVAAFCALYALGIAAFIAATP